MIESLNKFRRLFRKEIVEPGVWTMTTRLGSHPELRAELLDSLGHLRITLEKEPTLKKSRPSLPVNVL